LQLPLRENYPIFGFKSKYMKHVLAGLLVILATPIWVFSQSTNRSGQPIVAHPNSPMAIPCAGTLGFEEDFEAGLGAWTVLDLDGLTPTTQTGLVGGWQGRVEYGDTNNHVAVSPSWYNPAGQSEDWLISPAITLGSNPCLSWRVYSLDNDFKEAYEVRISTGQTDTASFFANPAIFSTTAESEVPLVRAASLLQYAGQTVHIAFRQTSLNEFVLVLDDVRVTNANQNDIGVISFEAPVSDPGDTIAFEITVANYGSDTVRSFEVWYSVENGPSRLMTFDSVAMAPNGAYTLDHSVFFHTGASDAYYDFCAWTSLPNQVADEDINNDSLCDRFAVGSPVGRPEPGQDQAEVLLFPNPAENEVSIQVLGIPRAAYYDVHVLDLQGRVLISNTIQARNGKPQTLSLEGLASGMHILHLHGPDGKRLSRKLIIR
jgi:hypothetical protein